jgi:peptidoglycan/LPS O-acetylase OafA/YrhL
MAFPLNNRVISVETKFGEIGYLDGWRGIAVTMVLISHFANVPNFSEGRFGVDLFFVLSGLLMANILFVKRTPLKTFYKRRITRIIPLTFLYALVAYISASFVGLEFTSTEVASTLLFLRTYFPENPHIWSSTVPIGHYWSLNVEEHCYIVLGIMAFFIRDRTKAGITLIILGIAAILTDIAYVYTPGSPIEHSLRTECASAPLLLSAGYCLIREKVDILFHPTIPLLTLSIAALTYTSWSPWWLRYLAPFLLAYSVNNMDRTYLTVKNIFSNKVIRIVGVWSFSIYIWQQPFYVNKELFGNFAIIPAMLTGVLSYYFFESPLRTWLNNRAKK